MNPLANKRIIGITRIIAEIWSASLYQTADNGLTTGDLYLVTFKFKVKPKDHSG